MREAMFRAPPPPRPPRRWASAGALTAIKSPAPRIWTNARRLSPKSYDTRSTASFHSVGRASSIAESLFIASPVYSRHCIPNRNLCLALLGCSRFRGLGGRATNRLQELWVMATAAQVPLHPRQDVSIGRVRSEERRVGKEGRSRWSPYN